MVCLVINRTKLPYADALVEELVKLEGMTSISININQKNTNVILGEKVETLWGSLYITDYIHLRTGADWQVEGDGIAYRISPQSFYQVNPVQTEILYKTAIEYAGLGRKETVIDAYCGIGTIGLVAAKRAKNIIGVELNPDAVRDARINAKENKITNARFYQGDAGEFMENMAENGEHADVVFMDPPRTGSDKKFMSSVIKLNPSRIVYISCGPETLARDLEYSVSYTHLTLPTNSRV